VVFPRANIRRHFLPWDRPLLPQAVAFLAGDWAGGSALDLSEIAVVVPTRQSGRRLREALAGYAAKRGAAVFPPRVMLPESLIAPGPAVTGVATKLESLLAWASVFRESPPGEFRAVFPVDPPVRNFTWALRLAREFARLQRSLAEAGLRLADVAQKAGDDFPEAERWRQIAALERRYEMNLARAGLRDAQTAERAQARAPELPEGVSRFVLLGAPDPLPLALEVLAAYGQTVPVEVVVLAPPDESAGFDDWGRPVAEAWGSRELTLSDFERRVHLCADPAAQAERTVAVARGYGEPEGALGVGVADPEVRPGLETGLKHAGLVAFNPEGRARAGGGLYQLLAALAGLVRDDAFATVQTLARCPDFLEFLGRRRGAAFSAARFLADLDDLHAEHLPPDLAEARRHRPESAELGAVAELRATLTTGAFPQNATAALAWIFDARRFDLSRPADALAAEAAEAWTEVLRNCARAAARFKGKIPEPATAEWWELALRLYGETTHFDDKPAGAVELQGWLELLWEDAPHLVVTGLNDGSVPDAVVGDPFLPEALRTRLGLKSNAARFARDAYLLQALAACRAASGRLDVLLGKTSAAGDPLRPSRLLLRCADEELPRRIEFLFSAAESARANPPWRRAWRLRPARKAAPGRVAVTALRAWLECPFRFYLSRVLRMEAVDPGKTELDALDFGTLCHAALEEMGRAPALRDCTDAAVLRAFLLDALDAEAARRFGPQLTLPLVVQLESARQRLSRAAEVQARTRAEGWVTERAEWKFTLDVGGLTVSGKIDRIDRHERTGAVRVIDYKTSDRRVQPAEAHRRPLHRDETARTFALFPDGTGRGVWRDLQLPLYLRAVAAEFPDTAADCAYFNLPKASGETAIDPWLDYTPELAESAWRCAEGVAAAIVAGEFWPPSEHVRAEYDAFAALFHHGVAESVAWEETP
jgi:ATP-dependent helicase/nuclease subunit B